MKMIVVITTHTDKWFQIADAWEKLGAAGVTIIDSYGLHRFKEHQKNIEIPPNTFSMTSILRRMEQNSRLIFTIVDDEQIEKMLQEAMRLLHLDEPDTGIAFVLDVSYVAGMRDV